MPEHHFILVIFGASGDLAEKKLLPALNGLTGGGFLTGRFAVLGTGRTPLDDRSFRAKCAASVAPGDAALLSDRLHYQPLNPAHPDDFSALRQRLAELNAEYRAGGNILFYLAVPPSQYASIVEGLGNAGLSGEAEGTWRRIIIEKPFGRDLASARALNRQVLTHFREEQVFRIDHYLGKETVQNLLVARFANGIFEPLWNRNYIRRVEITSAESAGVGARSGYYEQAGALRDMLQNHLLQLVAVTAMEPPATADAWAVRNETLKVFQSLRPLAPAEIAANVVRGQYTASRIRGEPVAGYREEAGIGSDSRTETYVAMKFFIDNWRWNGVPFLVRTGKRLPTRVTEIVVHFRQPPHHLFRQGDASAPPSNQLVIRIQPDEGLLLKFGLKEPGAGFRVRDVGMDFHYSDLSGVRLPDAYERLLLDCIQGDATLYLRNDAVEATWAFVDPVLRAWEEPAGSRLYGYPAGTWGPEPADRLVEPAGDMWREPCRNLTADSSFCEL